MTGHTFRPQSSNKGRPANSYKRESKHNTFFMFKPSYNVFKLAVVMGGLAILSWYLFSILFAVDSRGFQREKNDRSSQTLNDNLLSKISNMSDGQNFNEFRSILRPFLRTRVPDTEGNAVVRNHISSFMSNLGWKVELDSFSDSTPLGVKSFTNIIATSNPHAKKHLVLACHHDSKYFTDFEFIGATDSAVPCAMMMSIAQQLDKYIKKDCRSAKLALKFIFFDGEEAFEQWTLTDSLYGSRHLAKKMADERVTLEGGVTISKLEQIDLFVLLDLIGSSDTSFMNFGNNVYFSQIRSAEQRLKEKNLLSYDGTGQNKIYFTDLVIQGKIEDDHIPFLERGVQILHLISYPFPSVWHNRGDNESSLHYSTINNVMKCVRLFTIEYLGLQIH